MPGKSTRETIVETADQLFYQQGFDHTSFADISGALKISRGNFYYHFKTKDEILEAVIERRKTNTRAILDQWEQASDMPDARIRCFIRILITNRAKIMAYGCPVGTLSAELSKLDHDAQSGATAIFDLFRQWLAEQFTALGRKQDADNLAMHVLARSQGVATLANTFHDETFLRAQVDQMNQWLDQVLQQ